MNRAAIRLAVVFAVCLSSFIAARGAPPPLARAAALEDSLSSPGLSIAARGAPPRLLLAPQASSPKPQASGVREPAWSPDGKRLAVSWFEAIWTMTPEGRDAKHVVTRTGGWVSERDPAWSHDGKSIAFSADTSGEFDIWVAPAGGGAARRVTSMPGDERWPSWTRDGRVLFSHRNPKQSWQLYAADPGAAAPPVKLTPDADAEWQGSVSPDGKLVAFVSDRDRGTDVADIWVRELPAKDAGAAIPKQARVTSTAGLEGKPAWSSDSTRLAYFASRPGQQNGVWVSEVPGLGVQLAPGARSSFISAAGAPPPAARAAALEDSLSSRGSSTPTLAPPVLASRHTGSPTWSPDGQSLAIATFPITNAAYNGNPNRNDDDPPVALAGAGEYVLWCVDAPRATDQNARSPDLADADNSRWMPAFDRVWQTLKALYYGSGESAAKWDALRATYRPKAAGARDANAAEDAIDAMLAEQPLIKPALESTRAVVASGNPLASRAGALVLERGGNVVDAGIAVAFALGVVEPDATSIGGDGEAILFLKGMAEPVVVEYKDMTPSHALLDNPKIFNPNGSRTAPDGPTVANIPGVVAGLDLLYQKYGSKKVGWADLIAPAITLADEGFVLDEALPTTVAAGRGSFAKYPEAAKVFMPGGRLPRAGDRFVNPDYAETLRTLAREGGQSFYRGTIARRIAADMADNGGIITAEDLAQYRAMERKPLVGHYRNHAVFSAPPPVSTGAQLIETLNILDNYQPRPGAAYTSDADYWHYVIESWRVRDGPGRIGDPERISVDLGNHLEPAHALERFKLIDPRRAYVAPAGGRGGLGLEAWGVGPREPGEPGEPGEPTRVQTGTTAFVVADVDGNMIAFTQTLSTWGGNYYVSKGLGFLYNDHFRGGGRGVQPLTRSSSTSVPTLVFAPSPIDPGRYGIPGSTPLLAVGCAGNAWIPASVYNIITNVIDSRMGAQQAIEAPRFLIGNDGSTGKSRVQIEDRIPRAILTDLEARGHTFVKVGRKGEVKYGYAAVAVVNAAKGTVEGGAEPRRSHGTAAPGK